jgi:hypothetical protein
MALQQDRPAVFEIFGILVVCAVLLTGLAKMDNSAARREASRAQIVLAEQAALAARSKPSAKEQETVRTTTGPVTARTESLGSRGPISIPVGAAWSPGTSASVAHSRPTSTPKPPEVPSAEFRRIVGPTAAYEPVAPEKPAERQAPVVLPKTGAPATMRRAAPGATSSTAASEPAPFHQRRNMLLGLMAACGLVMCAGGVTILRRTH